MVSHMWTRKEDPAMADLIWYSAELQSSEHFVSEVGDEGQRLRGIVVLPIDGRPGHLSYQIAADAAWRTRQVDILIGRPEGETHIGIAVSGSAQWVKDGEPMPELSGCLDIDLGWTPATNTFQIRRLGLGVGDRQTLDVAWMRFPELTLERVPQTYHRLGPSTWRYSSGDFSAVLEVDDEGFVRRYGDDLWTAVAAADTAHQSP
jgi:uncharacterized protein